MTNKELEKVWKLRMKLRTKSKKLEIELNKKEIQSSKLNLESLNISKQLQYENGKLKNSKDILLCKYTNKCFNDSSRLKKECIKRSKEVADNIIESDKIWIDSILKVYGNINIKWIYDIRKDDYKCKLENGEIYLP